MITIRPKHLTELNPYWDSKIHGVVFVSTEEEIEPLWKALCEQDETWKQYRELIQVAPKEIDDMRDLSRYCNYVGKTDIYNVKELKERFNFLIYQYDDSTYYR